MVNYDGNGAVNHGGNSTGSISNMARDGNGSIKTDGNGSTDKDKDGTTNKDDEHMSIDVLCETGYKLLLEYAQLYLCYLQEVLQDLKWQELVTQWRDFKGRHPPVSVSS